MGLKPNQTHLYRLCTLKDLFKVADYQWADAKIKKHGRVEQRRYCSFTVRACSLPVRWQKAGVLSEEVSYYVSNQLVTNQLEADELFDTIRGHWGIEAMHHKRDVSLSEDHLSTGKAAVSRLTGSLRTLVVNLLKGMKVKNIAAQLDTFADDFMRLVQFLT